MLQKVIINYNVYCMILAAGSRQLIYNVVFAVPRSTVGEITPPGSTNEDNDTSLRLFETDPCPYRGVNSPGRRLT